MHMRELAVGKRFLAILWVVLAGLLATQSIRAETPSTIDQKIIHYVRERFGIPASANLTMGPLQNSEYSAFYQTAIYIQSGNKKKSQPLFLTKDKRYMVIGDVFVTSTTAQPNPAANASLINKKIVDYVRVKFKVPAAVTLAVGPFRHSEFAGFYQARISAQGGGKKSSTHAFVTQNGRYAVIGSIFDLNVDPRKEIEQAINLKNQPMVGPADAPVTIVEFADLECPSCAELQKFFETQLIPKYGNKVRIVFKEFPLTTIHDWALTAAIANECGYLLDPAAYFKYRSIIFESQDMINGANVRPLLLDFGQRAGLDRVKLAQCLDAKASLPRIEADVREGRKLGIVMTPTLYINGVPVIGFQPKRTLQLIDQDLRRAAAK